MMKNSAAGEQNNCSSHRSCNWITNTRENMNLLMTDCNIPLIGMQVLNASCVLHLAGLLFVKLIKHNIAMVSSL